MATEKAPFETDDWGKPDETKLLESSPDAAYLPRGPTFLPCRWLALRTASMVMNILSWFDGNEWHPMDA